MATQQQTSRAKEAAEQEARPAASFVDRAADERRVVNEALRPRLDWSQPGVPPAIAEAPFVVRDDAAAAPEGTMRRSAFLEELRAELTRSVEAALAGTELTTDDCPYLFVLFRFLEKRDTMQLDALVRGTAAELGAMSPDAFVSRMGEVAARAAEHWTRTGELGGLPPGLPERVGVLLQRVAKGPDAAAIRAIAGLGRGQPLDGNSASRMRGAFGGSLPDVSIHTNPAAAAAASRAGASAVAVGNHIAFGAGQYRPGTPQGDALLAHELAHVVQQRGGAASGGTPSTAPLERDADRTAAGVLAALWGRMTGAFRGPRLRSGMQLQRCKGKPDPDKYTGEDNPWGLRIISRDYPNLRTFAVGTRHTFITHRPEEDKPAYGGWRNVGFIRLKIHGPSGEKAFIKFPDSHNPPTITFDEPGTWEIVALVRPETGSNHTVVISDTFEVVSAETYGEELLKQSFGAKYDFERFRIALALEEMRVGGGVTKEQPAQVPGAPYITVRGDNPAEMKHSGTIGYQLHPSPGAKQFQWYFWADDLVNLGGKENDPSKAVIPGSGPNSARHWRELPDIGEWGFARASDKSASPSASLLLSKPNIYWVMCTELDEQGKPLGTPTAVYKQAVLGLDHWKELEKLRKHIKKVDTAIETVDKASEVPIRAVLVARDGTVTPLALFAGRKKGKDGDKVRLLDLTPNAPKEAYEVTSAAGAPATDALIDKFVKDNEYPNGYVTFEVPEGDGATALGMEPGTKTREIKHPKSFASRFSTVSGWVSMGATVLGFLALLTPVTAGASPFLFGVGAGAGAAAAGASLVARFQEGRATPTGVAIDLLGLAASLLQIKTLRVQSQLNKVNLASAHQGATIERGVRYLLYTQLAVEGAEAVMIAADTIIQIDAILDSSKDRGQKLDEVVRLLGQAALTGGLFIHSARSARSGFRSLPPPAPSQPQLTAGKRLRALDQSADEFAKDADAQLELFEAAKRMRDQQNELAQRIHVEELGGRGTLTRSALKKETVGELRDAIVYKMSQNKYETVSEMDDIVRGRFDADDPADAPKFAAALGRDPSKPRVQHPKNVEGVNWGYPRYHVIMKDPETGLTHEWQIGTTASTQLFERTGIRLGALVLPTNRHPNLHDIEYDIFRKIQKNDLPVAASLGIPAFRRELAEFAAKTGLKKVDAAELESAIADFHERASTILAKLIDAKGVAYVEGYLKK